MEVPRGFTRCDECEGRGAVSGFPDTPWEQCPSCSGSGLVPTEKLREEARAALTDYYGQECATDPAAADAVLSAVANHTWRDA